jgi:type I restriction enzyme, S subunit
MPRTSWEAMSEYRLVLPSLDEQRRIADFLDAETARIDGLASARRTMRDLLILRRERTAEKILGLDASPQMIPLKYAVRSVSVGIVITPANWYVDEGGVPALRGLNIQPGHIDASNLVQISHEGHRENVKSRLCAGDVVVVRTGQAGAAAVVPDELDGCNCIDLLIIRPGKKADPSFLMHYLNSFYARDKITEHSVGSIQSHFNVASMKSLNFPDIELSEQQRRAGNLDEVIRDLELLDSQLEDQLALLAERRQALITAAVTGGITV